MALTVSWTWIWLKTKKTNYLHLAKSHNNNWMVKIQEHTHTHARSLRREGDEDSRRSATVGSRCCCCFCLCICCRTGSWAEYCLKSALFIVFYSIFLHFHLIQHSSHIKALIAAFFIGKLYLYACVTLATSLTYFLSCCDLVVLRGKYHRARYRKYVKVIKRQSPIVYS